MMKKIYRIMALFLIAVLAMPAGVFAAEEEVRARFIDANQYLYVGEPQTIAYTCSPVSGDASVSFVEEPYATSDSGDSGEGEISEPSEPEKLLEIGSHDGEKVTVTPVGEGNTRLSIYVNGAKKGTADIFIKDPIVITFRSEPYGKFQNENGELVSECQMKASPDHIIYEVKKPEFVADESTGMGFVGWSSENDGELLSDEYINFTAVENGMIFYAKCIPAEHANKVWEIIDKAINGKFDKSEDAQKAIDEAKQAYDELSEIELRLLPTDTLDLLQQAQEKADKLKEQEEKAKIPSGNSNSGSSSGSGTASGGQSGTGGQSGSTSGAVNPYTVSSFGNYMSPVIIVNPPAATKFTSVKAGKAGSGKILLKWKKKKKIKGYQIQYSTKKSFKKGVKTINIKKAGTTKKTIKKLKKGKKYFVRIRTYKMLNGTPFYSAWSKVKPVRVK